MQRGILILILALLLAGTAFCGFRWFAGREARAMSQSVDGEMAWLRREFNLSDEQFSRVAALHEAYRPKCDALCAAVVAANAKLDAVIDQSRQVTPTVAAALKDVAAVEDDCHRAMLAHLYAVSAEMNPDAARRYVAMMKPRIVQSAAAHHRAMTAERH